MISLASAPGLEHSCPWLEDLLPSVCPEWVQQPGSIDITTGGRNCNSSVRPDMQGHHRPGSGDTSLALETVLCQGTRVCVLAGLYLIRTVGNDKRVVAVEATKRCDLPRLGKKIETNAHQRKTQAKQYMRCSTNK